MRTPQKALSLVVCLILTMGLALVDQPGTTAKTISSDTRKEFIASVVKAAQETQRSYGIPASVSIAQAIANTTWGTTTPARTASNYFKTQCSSSMTATQFAALADAQVGKPYVLGAEAAITTVDPSRFDCSELVQWLFGRSGNPITDLAAAQYDVTKKVSGSPKVGDLVFLRNNPARANGIGHVAVVTKKLSNGDWRIIEARGRASGVVRTTLSYWRTRSYYAGLRRYPSFILAGKDGVTSSAASVYQAGCITVGGTKYAKYSSIAASFNAHAVAVTQDSGYAAARAAAGNVAAYVDAIAKVEYPKTAADYAAKLNRLIRDYDLRDYDVVAFPLVLLSGDTGAQVKATQYLLGAAGYTVPVTGSYDKATVAAVKKYQKAKGLEVDGQAGPITLSSLTKALTKGDTGTRVSALHTLLAANGYSATGSTYGASTAAALKEFQETADRPVTGAADKATWAALYMTLRSSAPTIKGTVEVGHKLTATAGSWGPGSVTLRYQWYRNGSRIGGATASSYSVTIADAGSKLSVRVTGSKLRYTTTARTSKQTATVPLLKLTKSPTPTLSGKAAIGHTLTATAGTWAPSPVTVRYQWYRGSTAISGATGRSYTLTRADGGSAIKVAVTGTKAGYASITRSSAATATVPRLITTATPTVSGTVKVGQNLTAVPGAWSPSSVTLGYQWYRHGSAISGATARTYTLTRDDLDATIKVRVRATKSGYVTAAATSKSTAKVAPGTLKPVTPTVKGTRKAGHTLTAVAGDWGPGAVRLYYQWYRGSSKLSGSTSASYKLTSKDKGRRITVKVTGRKLGYEATTRQATVTIAG